MFTAGVVNVGGLITMVTKKMEVRLVAEGRELPLDMKVT